MKKTGQKEYRTEKLIKRKGAKLYVQVKYMIIHLIVGMIQNIFYKNESKLS